MLCYFSDGTNPVCKRVKMLYASEVRETYLTTLRCSNWSIQLRLVRSEVKGWSAKQLINTA